MTATGLKLKELIVPVIRGCHTNQISELQANQYPGLCINQIRRLRAY